MPRRWISLSLIIVLTGCGSPPASTANENMPAEQPATIAGEPPVDPAAIKPGQPGGLPDDRSPISDGSIDPKSGQGAGLVLQRYAGLLEQQKFAEARQVWSDDGKASGLTEKEFIDNWSNYAEIHSEIGRPGDLEGAAGSIYVEVPMRIYGKLANGKPFNMIGTVALRRVNDVDGSTEQQRQWHIASSDLKSTL